MNRAYLRARKGKILPAGALWGHPGKRVSTACHLSAISPIGRAGMKLHLANTSGRNIVTGYGDDHVLVNGARHDRSLVVLPDRLLDWSPVSFDMLSEADFAPLAELGLEMLLLGTGARLRFPHPRFTAALIAGRTGVEVMDLQAACRTFNILVAEERRVGAALLFR
jgi:uncharacterized protein